MMDPATIAAQLRELAVYYELDGDKHRAFAYDRAAKSVEAANGLHRLIDEGRLEELPGIGPSIARVVAELARRGTVAVLERLRAKWPAVVVELAQLPRVGVPKARKIHQALAPADLDAVAAMCRAGAISELPGFGKVSEQKILQAIEERRLKGAQVLLLDAEGHALSLAHHLRGDPAAIAGRGLRPGAAVVRDRRSPRVRGRDRTSRDAARSIGSRASRWSPRSIARAASAGAPVDRVPRGWAARRGPPRAARASSAGRRSARPARPSTSSCSARAPPIAGSTSSILEAADEAHVYRALGLPLIPPEVRDGTDEVARRRGRRRRSPI